MVFPASNIFQKRCTVRTNALPSTASSSPSSSPLILASLRARAALIRHFVISYKAQNRAPILCGVCWIEAQEEEEELARAYLSTYWCTHGLLTGSLIRLELDVGCDHISLATWELIVPVCWGMSTGALWEDHVKESMCSHSEDALIRWACQTVIYMDCLS